MLIEIGKAKGHS